LLLGRLDEARRLGDLAFESSQRQPGFAAHALHLLGDVAAYPGRYDAESAATRYREALVLARQYGMRPLVAHCHLVKEAQAEIASSGQMQSRIRPAAEILGPTT
jgi:hypothetical protein